MVRRLEQNMGDDAIRSATGRGHEEWRDLLDAAGARDWGHGEIAAWLVESHGVPGWWAQGITVDFEQARKGRLPGQQADGTFSTQKARTVPGDRLTALTRVVSVLSGALGEPHRTNLEAATPVARWRLEDGTRLVVTAGSENKSGTPITIVHEKLPDAALVDAAQQALVSWLATAAASG